MVQPSSRREGFSTIPNVKWEDIGGLDFLRKEFERYIVRRIKHPEDYEVLTIIVFSFIMLCVCVCVSHFARLHWKFKQKVYEGSSKEEPISVNDIYVHTYMHRGMDGWNG